MSMRALAAAVATARLVDVRPACSDRLDLVDRALIHARGRAAHELAEKVCPRCPAAIASECFLQGLDGGERGVWGGTLEGQRRRVRPLSPTYNISTRRSNR